ncbi:MAG: acyl-CoA dehydrogenase family protein [Chloroflexi bacterium]|nr:acyl-CoA dehydrogenase family protein [Chloroflexota bacterium]MCI0802210.1 acyl-CoA dehydrogenase family protein [Chloroflexota bacterium]MCI0811380.1 acyl-CoA dehydrogenase family protein [Chloroflexota bacterium]MCI0829465.1 acyl-CoA dehydrogenase family protein [Chloroflexota bacterium]MCI0898249.1 acyl-CoA dehydrogenase family protein [Chloroflexota bacterium]
MDFAFTPEQSELQQRVRRIAEEKIAPIAEEADESPTVHAGLMAILANEGLLRYCVPEEYGGVGVRVMDLCIIREELARVSVQADTNFIMQGLGSYPITLGGTDEQKAKYLPPIARGESIAAFALTEPHAGSDVLSMKMEAHLDGDDWVLNGQKKFISQAGDAGTYTVFAKTDPDAGSRSLSVFIVEAGTPGFDDSKRMDLMAAHPIGEPRWTDCHIPQANLIGERGRGLRLALGTLDTFRTTVAAAAIGMGQAAFEASLAYAKNREMFGKNLSDFQATQFKLADMAVSLDAARLLAHRAAWLKDSGQESIIKEASFAKLFGTEAASRIINDAVQIHGGAGLEKGNRVERLYREVRALTIYEGTSEIQRQTIARQLLRE